VAVHLLFNEGDMFVHGFRPRLKATVKDKIGSAAASPTRL